MLKKLHRQDIYIAFKLTADRSIKITIPIKPVIVKLSGLFFGGGGCKGKRRANNCQCYMYPRLETLYNVWKKLKYKSNLNNVSMNNLLSADQCSNVASTFRQIGKHNHCMPRLGTRTPPPLWKIERHSKKQGKNRRKDKKERNNYITYIFVWLLHYDYTCL